MIASSNAATASARCPGVGKAVTTTTTLISGAFLPLVIVPSMMHAEPGAGLRAWPGVMSIASPRPAGRGWEHGPMTQFAVRPATAGDARAMAELFAAVA